MKREVTILIADRNPNVREFLKRELAAENYQVQVAQDAKSLLALAFAFPPIDILILDPDFPDMEPLEIIRKLNDRVPPLPAVIHCLPDEERNGSLHHAGIFIEKESQSIDAVKKAIRDIIAARGMDGHVPDV